MRRSLRVWVHGSSLGDLYALTGLIRELELRECELTLSASTSSGRRGIQDQFPHLTTRRAPLLSRRRARRLLKERDIELLILELLEIWPAWLSVWIPAGVRVVVVDGRVSPRTCKARPLLKRYARGLSLFLAQSQGDAQRAIQLGVQSDLVEVCGDAKCDSALERSLRHRGSLLESSSGNLRESLEHEFRIALGCLRPHDERSALNAIATHRSSLAHQFILVAPRHITRACAILKRARKLGLVATLTSTLTSESTSHLRPHPSAPHLVILDQYGALASLYHRTHVAIIGGTFRGRGQGLIEAALAGCVVIHGPKTQTIQAQRDALIGCGGYERESWRSAVELAVELGQYPKAEIGVSLEALRPLQGALTRQMRALTQLFPVLDQS